MLSECTQNNADNYGFVLYTKMFMIDKHVR